MTWILFLLFIALPIAEIAVLIQAGSWIGLWPTVGLVILTAAVGAALARAEGKASMRRLSEAVERGGTPVGPLMDAARIFLGGVLLLTPGFITDLVGLSLLFRPTRLLWGGLLIWLQTRRGGRGPGTTGADRTIVIEGDYEETPPRGHDPDRTPRP